MKKIFYFVVVAMLSMTMVACGGNAEKKAEKSEEPIDKVLELQDQLEAAVEAGDYDEVTSISEQMQKLLQDPEVLEAYQKEMMKVVDDYEKAVAGVDDELEDAWDEAVEETADAYEEAVEEVADAYEDALSEYEDEYEDAVNAYEDAVEDAVSAYEDALSGLDW